VEWQAEQIELLRAEVAELRRQLGRTVGTRRSRRRRTRRLPSPAPKSLRRSSGRKPDGQPGLPGSTWALVNSPDERCGSGRRPGGGYGATASGRPAADDGPGDPAQLITRRCGSGATPCGAAPVGVTAPVQYGPRITAIILLPVCRAVPVQETDRAGVGRVVRHPGVRRGGIAGDQAGVEPATGLGGESTGWSRSVGHTPCSGHGAGRRRASLQWLHLWLHSLVISKAPGVVTPGPTTCPYCWAVTADQWVDDLESERAERHRGFESLRFRPSTSTNTEIMITSRPRADAGGCISGGIRATR
jgi:hypothetical protein